MQPASAGAPFRRDFQSGPDSVGLVDKFLIAGVTVAGAAAIAVNPVHPVLPALHGIESRAVHLAATALDNPITVWQETISTAVTNLETLGSELGADPLPILTQLIKNQEAYATTVGTDLTSAGAGLVTVLKQLPSVLQSLATATKGGDLTSAFSAVDVWALDGLEDVAKPLFPLLSIPGEVAQNFTNVVNAVFNTSNVFGIAKAVLAAPIGAAFEVADIVSAAGGYIAAGNLKSAITELVNLPAKTIDALVNGYVPDYTVREAFPGEFTTGGLLSEFLVTLPQKIAAALGATTATAAATTTSTTSATVATTTAATAAVASTALTPVAKTVTVSVKTPTTTSTAAATRDSTATTASDPDGTATKDTGSTADAASDSGASATKHSAGVKDSPRKSHISHTGNTGPGSSSKGAASNGKHAHHSS